MRIHMRLFRRALPTTATRDLWRMLSLCALVGVVAGLGAIAFFVMLDAARWFFLEYLVGYHPAPPGGETPLFTAPVTGFRRWMLLFLPALGGLIAGPIIYWLAPEAEGHGTDAAIDSYHNKGGKVRGRVPFIKALVSAITICSCRTLTISERRRNPGCS